MKILFLILVSVLFISFVSADLGFYDSSKPKLEYTRTSDGGTCTGSCSVDYTNIAMVNKTNSFLQSNYFFDNTNFQNRLFYNSLVGETWLIEDIRTKHNLIWNLNSLASEGDEEAYWTIEADNHGFDREFIVDWSGKGLKTYLSLFRLYSSDIQTSSITADSIFQTGPFGDSAVCLEDGTNCPVVSGGNSSWNETYANNLYHQQFQNLLMQGRNIINASQIYLNGSATTFFQGGNPGFWLDENNGAVLKGMYLALDNGVVQFQRRATNFGAFEASPLAFDVRGAHYTFGSDFLGRVNLGGASSTMFEGIVNFNSSRSYAPQIVFRNSTLSTSTFAGSLERVDNNLVWRNNSQVALNIAMLERTKTGLTGNYTNGNCWTAYQNGVAYATNCTSA
jgi:hypothetical protein